MLVAYCDADFAGDREERKSTTGYVIQVFGATVTWVSRKQATVAISTTEAQYVALATTITECIWMRGLLTEMGILDLEVPVTIFEDNQSCITIAREPRKHQRLKHIDVKYCFIKEAITSGTITLEYLSTSNQVADIMTKGLAGKSFKVLKEKLGLK